MKIETLADFLIFALAICASLAMGFMLGLVVGNNGKEPRLPEGRPDGERDRLLYEIARRSIREREGDSK